MIDHQSCSTMSPSVKLGGGTIAANKAVIKTLNTSHRSIVQAAAEQQPCNWGKLYSPADDDIIDINNSDWVIVFSVTVYLPTVQFTSDERLLLWLTRSQTEECV